MPILNAFVQQIMYVLNANIIGSHLLFSDDVYNYFLCTCLLVCVLCLLCSSCVCHSLAVIIIFIIPHYRRAAGISWLFIVFLSPVFLRIRRLSRFTLPIKAFAKTKTNHIFFPYADRTVSTSKRWKRSRTVRIQIQSK